MFWLSQMMGSPKAFFLSRRAPTATFHDSKHSIIHMQYEPTRGWLLTSGTDKVIKVGHCSHTRVLSVLFDKLWLEIEIILKSVVFTCSYGTWLQWYHENHLHHLQAARTKNPFWTEPQRTFRVQVPFHGQLHLMVEKLKDFMRFNWWFKLSMCICMYLCMWVMETNM